ncbi:Actin-like protein arp9 (SWI/SNF complex component arp9) [Gnomoniopsis smithogilvyi]|uniref:Actin-like protein arp9 (SWI/SNF complex component arp9) n=1 Tax=Gnomoniopsis smithogilvyi TaxID=1191159 RepID=A0A9W8YPK5_9PEZI|nr:Actin-like protein arp9 (SWI/SNF complex component arp9) [Gnomoniopsis smithogilvyi]
MSGSTKWREEQVLVICPGSSTTMAQLGCSELTPPSKRFPTRMFWDAEATYWRPYRTYTRKKKIEGAINGEADEEEEIVEDPDSIEGAVYPLRGGAIVNMEAFLAFLDHVHSMLTTTYHNTPIVLMASPQWTRPDCEAITRYIFERTKTPALCLLHSGVATQYGLRWPSLTVVDIGYEKVDVTCIYENRLVSQRDVRDVVGDGSISGGNVFTKRLYELLKDDEHGFTEEMAEQLKKSHICEVLSYAPERPELMELPTDGVQPEVPGVGPAPAAAASGTTVGDAPAIIDAEDGDELTAANDGVLNIADIVTSGQTKEFLAKKEKEKAEKAKAGKKNKAAADAADASRALRLPNSKRLKSIFHYEEVIQEEPSAPPPKANGATNGDEKKEETDPAVPSETSDPAAQPPAEPEKPKEPEQSSNDPFKVDNFLAPPETTSAPAGPSEPQSKRVRRDIEIGLERFTFADRAEIDRIASAIYEAIQNINEMYMRPACWENIVFVGNGSRIRGLKDNIVQTLTARHLISPSSATMFTSELPSNMATPSGTGSQTPTGSFSGPPHTMAGASSGVNPLLQAATTASLQQAQQQQQQHPGMMTPGAAPGSQSGEPVPSHHFHSQTPTAIKMAGTPTYLAEWTKHGFEEAMFLGSLVAARLAFCVHNMDAQGLEAQRLMSLNRVDFNELGPKGVRTHSMLG